MQSSRRAQAELWPALPYGAWKDTCATLHLWTQIVGKIRLAQTPWINHSWHVTLYVTPRGLTTSPIPYDGRAFQIDFDFIDHALLLETSDGETRRLALEPRSVAEFYEALMAALAEVGVRVRIHGAPTRWRTRSRSAKTAGMLLTMRTMRSASGACCCRPTGCSSSSARAFCGKVSPVHFFWGSFDLAVTRFSGRTAPPHPGRHSQSARRGHPRSLFARGQQCRLLARRRRDRLSGVLLVRLSDARGLRDGAGSAGGGVLPRATRRVHPALRCRAHRRGAG